jgi:phage-related tail fiber protein
MSAGITANNDGSADITVGGIPAIEISASGGVTIPNLVSGGVPSGTVSWFAAATPPTGYLKANGAAVSRATYSDLFAVIGTTYGSGDGSTTFNLPDLRGQFLRGWDDGRGVDPARVFGSSQLDAFQGHFHGWRQFPALGGGSGNTPLALAGGSINNSIVSDPISDGVNGTPRTGSETRPRNVALLACIKT